MNRRAFLKVVTATAAFAAVPSIIPDDAKFVLLYEYPSKGLARIPGGPGERVIGKITRTIEWHVGRLTYFVSYAGRINDKDFYVSYYSFEVDEERLCELDANALLAFKGTPTKQSIMLSDVQLESAMSADVAGPQMTATEVRQRFKDA